MERTDKAQIDQVAQEGTDGERDLEDDVTWSASQAKQLTLRSAKPTRWQRADQIWRRLYLLHFHDTIRVTLSLFHVHMHSFHFDLIEKSNRRATSLTRADAPLNSKAFERPASMPMMSGGEQKLLLSTVDSKGEGCRRDRRRQKNSNDFKPSNVWIQTLSFSMGIEQFQGEVSD